MAASSLPHSHSLLQCIEKELANRMLESGYKTTSTNFSVALYQVLHNARNKGETFDVDAKTGNWVLRK